MTSTHKDSLITGLPRNIQETLTNAESPFDIMVDYTNFWGRVSGFEFLKIDKSDGIFITWTEMNGIWREMMEKMKVSTGISSFLALVTKKGNKLN